MRLAYIALALSLSACVGQPPRVIKSIVIPPFDAAEHEQFLVPGTASIEGQAFLRQRGGGVVTCAGAEVTLMPATAYYDSIVRQLRAGAVFDSGLNVQRPVNLAVRKSICDAQGHFAFQALPSGAWHVLTTVAWSVGSSQQGGLLVGRVTTASTPAQIILTDPDRASR